MNRASSTDAVRGVPKNSQKRLSYNEDVNEASGALQDEAVDLERENGRPGNQRTEPDDRSSSPAFEEGSTSSVPRTDRRSAMKAALLIAGSGPLVILTSHAWLTDPALIEGTVRISFDPRESARKRRDAGGVDRDHHSPGVLRRLA